MQMSKNIKIVLFIFLFLFYLIGSKIVNDRIQINYNIFSYNFGVAYWIILNVLLLVIIPKIIGLKRTVIIYFLLLIFIDFILVLKLVG